ncbi:hypothetical protein J2Z37_004073 [Ammoniphilus resinae]|uniref:Uncharacterized protein n=1 Tax=Ammoniphilus resinae TaxID=861532 RepID=A0ABS4GUW1_9BACL|nr:hypothetical protein [Ammoniphilus resinae]
MEKKGMAPIAYYFSPLFAHYPFYSEENPRMAE